MFIYILNFLNDGLKKNTNTCKRSDFQIINDTWYISQMAGIKKSFDFKNITDKIMDVFEVLNKYNITSQESMGILNKLIKNNNNSWILEYFYNDEEPELAFSSLINNIFEKKQKDMYICENNLLGEMGSTG